MSKLRERGIDYWSEVHDWRAAMTRAYVGAGVREFAPRCHFEHDQVPLDWGHMLAALYRVRCNLFHGEKARSSEHDQLVVGAAYEALLAFLDESRVLD